MPFEPRDVVISRDRAFSDYYTLGDEIGRYRTTRPTRIRWPRARPGFPTALAHTAPGVAVLRRILVNAGDCTTTTTPHSAPSCEQLRDPATIFFFVPRLLLGKSTKLLLPQELHFLTPTFTKSFVDRGFAADLTEGAYSAPPDFLVVFRGPASKTRVGERRD